MFNSFKAQKKLVAIWSLFSIILNIFQPTFVAITLAPIIIPKSVIAQEATPSDSPTPTVTPSVTPTNLEPSSAPSISPDPSVVPSTEPTPSPIPDATLAPSATPEPSVLPSDSPSPTPNSDQPNSPVPSSDSSPAPPVEGTFTPTPSASANPTVSPSPSPELNEQLNISIVDHVAASSIEEIDLTVTESGSATLATDKADYAPTDTAIITGAGFLANTSYQLVVSSTDEPATSSTVEVTTDADGSLFYAYQLDGIYRPNYKVEAKDTTGAIVAVITFTDSQTSNATIPFSDSFGSTDINDVTSWADSDGSGTGTIIEGTDTPRAGSTTGHVRIGSDDSICRTFDGSGKQSFQLSYYWRGDADAESQDDGFVEYKIGTCTGTWSSLTSHNLDDSTQKNNWSSQQNHSLSSTLNNQIFSIRFRSDANYDDEQFRIDDVSITASALVSPDLQVTKTNNVGGNTTINQPFTWTLTVTNAGTGTATFSNNEDILQDNLPDANDFDYSPTSNISVSTAGGVAGGFDCDIDNDDDLDCDADGTVSIPAGGSFSLNINATPTSTGTFTNPRSGGSNKCQVDPDGLEAESSEANNNCSSSITVSAIQQIANPSLNATCGLDIALILDVSGSIDNTELSQMKSAITGLVTALSGTPTQFSVTKFDTTASVVQAFSGNTSTVNSAINGVSGGGYTNWQDGLLKGNSTLPNRSNPNLVIFASDGQPNTIGNGPADNASPDGSSAAMNPAITIANTIKSGGSRILGIGIGLNSAGTANMKLVSGPNANTGNFATSDLITTNFDTLASQLSTFASQTCGSTLTITKLIDADGKLNTTDDRTPASGWTFNVGGQSGQVTDASGQTSAITLTPNTGYSVTETLQNSYQLLSASCTGATQNGTSNGTNAVTGIQVDSNDVASCTFINAPIEKIDICHAHDSHTNPYNLEHPDRSGDVSGHDGHNGGVWYPGIADHSWGDIIPPFDYIGGRYEGQNWDTVGQAIYNNGCNIPKGKLTVNKLLSPSTDPGLFNLTINSTIYASNVGNNGTTGAQSVNPATYTVGETAGTNTDLSNYSVTYSGACNGTNQVTVGVGEEKVCTITNTRKVGQITFVKEVLTGSALPTDWSFNVLNVGTFTNGTFNFNTGVYSVTETSNNVGYSLTSVDGACSAANLTTGSATLTVGENGGTCTFRNTRDTGSVKVNKLSDENADGTYETSNPTNFTWSLDNVGTNVMGTSVSNVTTTVGSTTHSISENSPAGYHFVGWYPTINTQQLSCANPQGTTLPVSINVAKDLETQITLCNQKSLDSIKIVKDVFGGTNDLDFNFSGSGVLGNFILDDNGNESTNNSGKPSFKLFSGVAAGSYTVTESATTGWDLSSLTCTGDSNYDVNGSTVTIDLDHGENVVCTFVNRQQTGSITIVKDADPNSDDNFSFDVSNNFPGGDFELEDDGNDNNGGTEESKTVTVPVGQYIVEEDGESGWALANLVCSDANSVVNIGNKRATINLESNESVTCTFTNKKLATLIIKKDATPTSDENFRFTRSFGGSFELEDDGNDNNGGTDETITFSNLNPGSYTVTEDAKSGWALDNVICSDQSQPNLNNKSVSVDLAFNETVTCTFKNIELGKIEGVKFNDKDADTHIDFVEPKLNGWTIFIDANKNRVLDNNELSDVTSGSFWFFGWHDRGEYSFSNLLPGEYSVCEIIPEGSDWFNSTPVCQTTTLTTGDTDDIDFGNYKKAKVTIKKDVVDANGNPTTDTSTGFQFNLTGEEGSFTLYDEDGGREFALEPGNYNLDENKENENYEFAGCYIQGQNNNDHDWDDEHDEWGHDDEDNDNLYSRTVRPSTHDYRFNVRGGDEFTIVCKNKQKTGDLEIIKYNDINGDGNQDDDEEELSGWTMHLSGGDNFSANDVTDSEGVAQFNDLLHGEYTLNEVQDQDGWTLINISCTPNEREESKLQIIEDNEDSYEVVIEAGETTYCKVGNQREPVLRIQKSNDATGAKNPGDIVTYTLVVDLLSGSNVDGVEVIDVTPDGFEYIAGSWTVDLNGLPLVIEEPNYASPGVWSIGDMVIGDIITLTYQVKISANQDGGIYNDLAWAEGESKGWGQVLALGHDSEFIDADLTFVGTDVEVRKTVQETGTVDIEKEGEVLGASTELPATGANTNWLFLALGALITGLFLIFGGKRMKKLSIGALIFVASFAFTNAPSALAVESDPMTVRIETPASPIRISEWKLSFSVLDRSNGTPVVNCFVKKPSSASFIGFGATQVSSKTMGDNGNCQVNSSVLTEQGDYQFYVTAVSGAYSENSPTVTVKYDTNGPSTPTSYNKEHSETCKWIIKFHTADDGGATTKVEIYSSDNMNFDTHSGTRVGTVNIGSNQDGSFTHDRSGDCDREWYYVIRAFDSAGNQSGHRGDEKVTITTIESSPTTAALLTTSATGNILGRKDVQVDDSKDGDILGDESTESAETVEGKGLVESVADAVVETTKNKSFWWIILTIIALRIVYGIARKEK